jgi:hypothetical protein
MMHTFLAKPKILTSISSAHSVIQRSTVSPRPMDGILPIVHDMLRAPGQPLEAETRAFMEPRFGHDFSQVRVHKDGLVAESAGMVNALAYTLGNHIVFGEYTPDTLAGRRLMAHELTHVIQQSNQTVTLQPKPVLGPTGDVFEQAADKNAGQINTSGPIQMANPGSAPVSIQRQTAATEAPDLRQRRLTAASRLRTSVGQFRGALSGGLQWNFERILPQGNQMGIGSSTVIEPMPSRQTRLTQLMNDLIRFTTVLESGPIPANWLNQQLTMPPSTFQGAAMSGGIQTNFGSGPEWEDPLRFFTNWQMERGRDVGILSINLIYIPDPPQAGRVAAIPRVAMATGTNIGVWIVVPNADTQPMQYHRLRSDEVWPAGGTIYEIWHDSAGYYYLHRGERHYLPGRPEF